MSTKKIIVVTTKGCEACNIAEKLIRKAMNNVNIQDIEFNTIDCLDLKYNMFVDLGELYDFPTTLIIKDNIIVEKYTGTIPLNILEKKIKEWFLY